MINKNTYYSFYHRISDKAKFEAIPALKAGHELVDMATAEGTDWEIYDEDQDTREAIDLYFKNFGTWYTRNHSADGGPRAEAAKPAPSKKPGIITPSFSPSQAKARKKIEDKLPPVNLPAIVRLMMPKFQQDIVLGEAREEMLPYVQRELAPELEKIPALYYWEKKVDDLKKQLVPGTPWGQNMYRSFVKPAAHYFVGGTDIWILELDKKTGEAFAYTILNGDSRFSELGYVSIHELTASSMLELDFHYDTSVSLQARLHEADSKYFDEEMDLGKWLKDTKKPEVVKDAPIVRRPNETMTVTVVETTIPHLSIFPIDKLVIGDDRYKELRDEIKAMFTPFNLTWSRHDNDSLSFYFDGGFIHIGREQAPQIGKYIPKSDAVVLLKQYAHKLSKNPAPKLVEENPAPAKVAVPDVKHKATELLVNHSFYSGKKLVNLQPVRAINAVIRAAKVLGYEATLRETQDVGSSRAITNVTLKHDSLPTAIITVYMLQVEKDTDSGIDQGGLDAVYGFTTAVLKSAADEAPSKEKPAPKKEKEKDEKPEGNLQVYVKEPGDKTFSIVALLDNGYQKVGNMLYANLIPAVHYDKVVEAVDYLAAQFPGTKVQIRQAGKSKVWYEVVKTEEEAKAHLDKLKAEDKKQEKEKPAPKAKKKKATPKPKAKKKPAGKKVKVFVVPDGKKVASFNDEMTIIRKVALWNMKDVPQKQFIQIGRKLNKLIVEQKIRKTSPNFDLLVSMQKAFEKGITQMGEERSDTIIVNLNSSDTGKQILEIANSQWVINSVPLIKRYVNMMASFPDKGKAQNLYNAIQSARAAKKFTKGDVYAKELKEIEVALKQYIDHVGEPLKIHNVPLSGVDLVNVGKLMP